MKILYAHTAAPGYVRVKKNLPVFAQLAERVVYFGAYRSGSAKLPQRVAANVSIEMMPQDMPHGAKSVIALLAYMWQLRRKIRREQPDVVVITNEELYLACIGLSGRTRVVLDAIDAIDIRRASGPAAKTLLNTYMKFVRKSVACVVEVEDFRAARLPALLPKTVVIRNTPVATQVPARPVAGLPAAYIYASGSLNEQINGIETLIAAAAQAGVQVVIAGYLLGAGLVKLVEENPGRVQHLGAVSHEDSLAIGAGATAIFAHYDPRIQNFRQAAPNKVYEAFMLGKPLLINSECVIAQFARDHQFGYTSEYGNVAALADCIATLQLDLHTQRFDSGSVRDAFSRQFSWEREGAKWAIALGCAPDRAAELLLARTAPQ